MAQNLPDEVWMTILSSVDSPIDGALYVYTTPMTDGAHGDTDPPGGWAFYLYHSIGGFFTRQRAGKYVWDIGLDDIAAGDTIAIWGVHYGSPVNFFLEAYISDNEVTTTARLTVAAVDGGWTEWELTQAFIDELVDLGAGKFAVRIVSDTAVSGTHGLVVYEADADLTPPVGGEIVQGTASIAAEGSVGTQGQVIQLASASVSAAAEVSAVPNQVQVVGAVSIEGSAVVETVGHAIVQGVVAMEASAGVSAAGHAIVQAVVDLSADAVVSVTSNQVQVATASLDGAASVTAVGLVSGVVFGIVDIQAAATVDAAATAIVQATAALLGVAEVSAVGHSIVLGTVLLSGVAEVSAVGYSIAGGIVDISGSATVSAIVSQILEAQASMVGTAVVVASGAIGAAHTIEKQEEVILGGEGMESIHVYSDGVEYWILD